MNKAQLQRGQALLDTVEEALVTSPPREVAAISAIKQLRELLAPPPTVAAIFKQVPGENIAAKARTLKITRPTFYDLAAGRRRPTDDTLKRLAKATGIPLETLRNAMP